MAIDIAQVIAQFGNYYIQNEDNMRRLSNMLYHADGTASYFQKRPTADTIFRCTMASLSRVVQPFQKGFTPIGTLLFKPNQFPLFKLKVDMQEEVDVLEPSYLGFMAALEDLERANWPIIRWLIEVHVMAKIKEDLELNEYWGGVFAAPAPGMAGDEGTGMDGLKKILDGYNTAGRTNMGDGPIVLGALPADDSDLVDYLEEFADKIPKLLRKKVDGIFIREDKVVNYIRGKRKKYNQHYAQSTDLKQIEDYPHIKIIGLDSMAADNTDRIWATIPQNRLHVQKKAGLKETMKIESEKRVVNMFNDWWEVLNFEVPEFIITNDQ